MNRIALVVFCILAAASVCAAQSVLYFPQVVDGNQGGGFVWGTVFFITNPAAPGSAAASGTLTLTKDDGTPWSKTLIDVVTGNPLGFASAFSFQLAGGQTKILLTLGAASPDNYSVPLAAGFATVRSNRPLVGGLVFDERGPIGTPCNGCQQSIGRIAEAGVPPATPLMAQTTVALASNSGEDANSAIAIANPGTGTANITFQILDLNGASPAPPVTRTLAGGNHTAFFINQLFPNMDLIGTVRITSDVPLVSTALVFEHNGQFATIPVFPLQ